MTLNPPRVFISYSHDSAEHKKWVLEFATTLRNRGVDAILDQWDLKPGADLPEFMEQSLMAADWAVMVCTKRYIQKANAGEGGVGYETMIMTASSLKKISENKIIPIIREMGTPATPTFLATKLYIDFSKDSDIEFALDDLLRHLLNAPLYRKPKIGSDPFRPLDKIRPDPMVDGLRTIMEDVARAFDRTSDDYISFSFLLQVSKLRRFTLEKYLQEAINKAYVYRTGNLIYIRPSGRSYLNDQGIVDA